MSDTPEARFAAKYLRREKRERLLHELTDPKKRYRGLDRFCHHAGELIDPKKDASILLGQGFALVTGEAVKGGREHYLLIGGEER